MKLRLLDYGALTADEGWVFEASGVATKSNPAPESQRRDFQMVGALIEHPKSGLILYEAGPATNHAELWPEPVQEVVLVLEAGKSRKEEAEEPGGHPSGGSSASTTISPGRAGYVGSSPGGCSQWNGTPDGKPAM